ncbi:hypothetical protein BHE74_00047462 [Ensete ventricosum]|nr:hypothetical protein GW17_00002354 [Ensete ventricosum]RWW46596.1 hypothetical protein BHE74_00047462 [Ensete ventricosum]
MAGGTIVLASGAKEHPGKMTLFVFVTCLVASSGGLIFGYDIGISGDIILPVGVPAADGGLDHQPVLQVRQPAADTLHVVPLRGGADIVLPCVDGDEGVREEVVHVRRWDHLPARLRHQWRRRERPDAHPRPCPPRHRNRLRESGKGSLHDEKQRSELHALFLTWWFGVGVQSVPLYLSEMAPAKLRGMLNIGFQLMITIGIFAANLINYGTASIEGGWGWRVSLGLAAVPAVIITVGSLALPDTPNSLIERGYDDEAKAMLRKIRGTEDIHAEYDDLVAASAEAKSIDHPWSNILQRRYRPQLCMAILIPFFQQLTGINVIMFYAPVLFKTIGFGSDASLASAVISGIVNVFATFVSIATVDKLGRRKLFLQGGTQMLVSQLVVGTLIALKFGTTGVATDISTNYASIIVLFICFYVAAFAWSWGPLGWLVPSEIFPLEIRSAGQSITVSVNMLFTFIIAQVFLTALCHLKFGLFYFFAGWVVIMTVFVALFLPETKNVPIEEIVLVWKKHWFWGNFISDDDIHVGNLEVAKHTIEAA